MSVRSGARTSSRIGAPRSRGDHLQRRLERIRLHGVPDPAEPRRALRRRLPDDPGHDVGEGCREPGHGSDGARGHAVGDQRLGADEHVEPVQQIRRHAVERRVGDLHAGEVRGEAAQLLDHARRDRVAAAGGELVDVERRRRARGGRGREVRQLLRLVQREVRRRDHGDSRHAERGRVLGELDRVGRRLRAAVDRDVDPPVRGGRERRRDPLPLLDGEEHALARRAEHEHAVDSAGHEEVDVPGHRLLVDGGAAVAQRRERGSEGAVDHGSTIADRRGLRSVRGSDQIRAVRAARRGHLRGVGGAARRSGLQRRRDRLRRRLLARLRRGAAARGRAARGRHRTVRPRAAGRVHGPRRPRQEVQHGAGDARPHRGSRESRRRGADRHPSRLPAGTRAGAGARRRGRPARRPARAAREEGPARAVRRRGDGTRARSRLDRRRRRDRVARGLRPPGARLRAHARDERRRVHGRRRVRVGAGAGRRRARAGRAVPHSLLRHRVREPQRDEAPAVRRGHACGRNRSGTHWSGSSGPRR